MIKKLKIGLLALTALAFVFVGANIASATVTYSVDHTIDLISPDINLTILADSVATSVITGTGTVTVEVPSGSTFVITSASRSLSTDIASTTAFTINNNCSAAQLQTLTLNGASASGTVIITPGSAKCSTGGGGGGGGGGAPAPDTTAPTATSISINTGALTSAVLASTLTLAATDATQMIVSNDAGFTGATWETYATSKAWTLISGDGVKTVYAKFRDAALNMSTAVSDTITVSASGTEVVVPPAPKEGCSGGNQYNTSTGALCVNNVVTQIPGCGNRTTGFSTTSAGVSCVGNKVDTTVTSYNLGTKTLKNGSKGDAVKELQKLLNKLLNLGLVVDGKLGPKTIKVIKTWQKNHDLVPDGLVGAKTKAKMKIEAEK